VLIEQEQIAINKTARHRLFDEPMVFKVLVRIGKGRAPDHWIDIDRSRVDVRAPTRERD
jgi:hypothetical protein